MSTTFLKKFKVKINSYGSINKKLDYWVSQSVESVRLFQEELVEVDLKEIREFVEEAVLLLGQASNSISYHKRFYMVSALTKSQ